VKKRQKRPLKDKYRCFWDRCLRRRRQKSFRRPRNRRFQV